MFFFHWMQQGIFFRQLQNCPWDHQVQNNREFIQFSLKLRIIWTDSLNHIREWYKLPLTWMTPSLALKDLSNIGHIVSFRSWQTLGLCKEILCKDQICQHVKCLSKVRNKDVQKKIPHTFSSLLPCSFYNHYQCKIRMRLWQIRGRHRNNCRPGFLYARLLLSL